MAKTHETIADIIAEIRALSNPISDGIIAINGRIIADRIEAAHKREAAFHAMTCEANDRLREHLRIALDANGREHADALAMRRLSRDRYTPGYFLHRFPMRRATFAPDAAAETTFRGAPQQMELFAS